MPDFEQPVRTLGDGPGRELGSAGANCGVDLLVGDSSMPLILAKDCRTRTVRYSSEASRRPRNDGRFLAGQPRATGCARLSYHSVDLARGDRVAADRHRFVTATTFAR